jgi:large-conductance mechanosensitive channel
MLYHLNKFKNLLISANALAYTLTVILGLIIAQFLKSIIDELIMPIIYSFISDDNEQNKFWENLDKKKFKNPFTNKNINIRFAKILSELLYLLSAFICVYIIYIKVFKKIDKKLF